MNSTLDYFTQHGPMSDPGAYAALYANLPTAIPELVKVVQGVTIHVFWTERYGFKAPPERMDELQLRSMEKDWHTRWRLTRACWWRRDPLKRNCLATAAIIPCCWFPCCASRVCLPAPAADSQRTSCRIILKTIV